MTTYSITIEQPDDHQAIEALHEEGFGPGRFTRTAFRLREGQPHRADVSFIAMATDGALLGSVRLTDICIGEEKALLLGPLVVASKTQNLGIGRALVRASLAAAEEAGDNMVLLVGDAPYYQGCGFQQIPPGQVQMPGPVDEGRLLLAALKPGMMAKAKGPVRPLRAS